MCAPREHAATSVTSDLLFPEGEPEVRSGVPQSAAATEMPTGARRGRGPARVQMPETPQMWVTETTRSPCPLAGTFRSGEGRHLRHRLLPLTFKKDVHALRARRAEAGAAGSEAA